MRDLFMTIFFASVGMHLYPTFLAENAWLVCSLTLSMMVIKYVTSMIVLLIVMPSPSPMSAHVISMGLAQVSEFGFVLASRGSAFGLISSPIYFLLLSVTGLSLLIAPFTWALALRTKALLDRP